MNLASSEGLAPPKVSFVNIPVRMPEIPGAKWYGWIPRQREWWQDHNGYAMDEDPAQQAERLAQLLDFYADALAPYVAWCMQKFGPLSHESSWQLSIMVREETHNRAAPCFVFHDPSEAAEFARVFVPGSATLAGSLPVARR